MSEEYTLLTAEGYKILKEAHDRYKSQVEAVNHYMPQVLKDAETFARMEAQLDAVTRERDEYDKARQEIAALCVRTLLAIKEYGLDT